MIALQTSERVANLINGSSRLQLDGRGRRAEPAAPIPPAAKASVRRFEAIKTKIDAYEKSHRQPSGDDHLAEVRLGPSF